MCVDTYVTTVLVADRLNELRADAVRARTVMALTPPLRVALGRTLIRLGRWLAAPGRMQPSAT